MTTIAETSMGKVAGVEDAGVHVFRGIPYARPPIGTLRFRSPQPPTAWAGVREATRFGPAASQNPSMLGPLLGLDVGQLGEDCLYLNVWTPNPRHGRRPVMVWIHGGAFVMGAGSQLLYDGQVLARRGDVVVVTINYRLGAFGFLHLDELTEGALPATGNEGLLDQIAALEWVHDNIDAFGGDPHNVTIFGESAGSISVATLLGTPRAQGLFHRAILQSGSANFVSTRQHAARVTAAVLKELQLDRATIARLSDLPAAAILEAQLRAYVALLPRLRGLPFSPVVDGDVLPQHPFVALRDGLSKDVSVLVGTNLDEMRLFGLMDPRARSLDDAGLIRRCERVIPGADAAGMSHGRRAVATYRQARDRRGLGVTPPELWFAIDSDRAFRYGAMRLAELQAVHQPQTYAYLFTWTSPFMEGMLGACHALEIPFVFGTLTHPMVARFTGSGPRADRLAEDMQDAWLTFAHNGRPAGEGLETWNPYDATRRATMILGDESRLEGAPYEEERRFWEFWDAIILD